MEQNGQLLETKYKAFQIQHIIVSSSGRWMVGVLICLVKSFLICPVCCHGEKTVHVPLYKYNKLPVLEPLVVTSGIRSVWCCIGTMKNINSLEHTA